MFRIGVSFGRNDLNVEGHLQMGYNSKTIKNYTPIHTATNEMTVAAKTTSTAAMIKGKNVDVEKEEEGAENESPENHS